MVVPPELGRTEVRGVHLENPEQGRSRIPQKGGEASYDHQKADGTAGDSRSLHAGSRGHGPGCQRHAPTAEGCDALRGSAGARLPAVHIAKQEHGPPLEYQSCHPPVETSSYLTVGTPDVNGAAATRTASVSLNVIRWTLCPPDTSDLTITASITDVRCKPARLRHCASGGTPSAGQTTPVAWKAARRSGYPTTGTSCSGRWDRRCDGHRHPVTRASELRSHLEGVHRQHLLGRNIHERARARRDQGGRAYPLRVTQIQVFDGGADGNLQTDPDTLFEVQGVFVP